ncbi:MAG: GNAT family N-acetyltransferase [Acidilobaceae archaeon]|nr:GNAT family N-acetyltransferase [Acidilobaceae archaeon]MDW7974412.1 GNAT family N-acetyltransferase [Sulfolobales archaeon]
MRLEVRLAGQGDAEQLSYLIARLKSLNEELDPLFKTVNNLHEVVQEYVRESVESDRVFILIAQNGENGEIAGIVRVEMEDRLFYVPRIVAVISDIYVKPKYRRRKVATLLLERAKEEAKKRGAGMLIAVYPANNMIAESFYSRAGFKLLQVEKYVPL